MDPIDQAPFRVGLDDYAQGKQEKQTTGAQENSQERVSWPAGWSFGPAPPKQRQAKQGDHVTVIVLRVDLPFAPEFVEEKEPAKAYAENGQRPAAQHPAGTGDLRLVTERARHGVGSVHR